MQCFDWRQVPAPAGAKPFILLSGDDSGVADLLTPSATSEWTYDVTRVANVSDTKVLNGFMTVSATLQIRSRMHGRVVSCRVLSISQVALLDAVLSNLPNRPEGLLAVRPLRILTAMVTWNLWFLFTVTASSKSSRLPHNRQRSK